jgi:hypothetical protein
VLSVEITHYEDEVVARCPELRLTDHGATEEQAEAHLRSAVDLFIRTCIDRGTLYKTLHDRGLLTMDRQPARAIHVPIPASALAAQKPAVH